MTVFVVVTGQDWEGYEIDNVFSTKDAAELYLDRVIPKWIKDKHGDRRPSPKSHAYASIIEFEVAS